MYFIIFILNVIISLFKPIKYIPQLILTINTKKVADLSALSLSFDIVIHILGIVSFSLIYMLVPNHYIFIPLIFEKALSFSFIFALLYCKIYYNNYDNDNNNKEEYEELISPPPTPLPPPTPKLSNTSNTNYSTYS